MGVAQFDTRKKITYGKIVFLYDSEGAWYLRLKLPGASRNEQRAPEKSIGYFQDPFSACMGARKEASGFSRKIPCQILSLQFSFYI